MPDFTAHNSASQQEVFAFLGDPATHGGKAVDRIDTHGAAVFLAGDRALKVKRAVRFPFLDYSTLSKRKEACEQELTVNRRFAPQIYRRVVAITRTADGSLQLGGDGAIVEWALEMTRFDERQTVDHLAAAGPIEFGLVAAIAEAIAASHKAAPEAETAPWVASIPSIIAGNSNAFRAAGGFDAEQVAALDRLSLAAFERIRPLLQRRGQQGFVRHCHGDLHLANIALINHRPVLFDAIEFDPKIASIDVLYDLAFPLMDFIHNQRRDAANLLLNRYLAITSDANLDALAALPLLMSMRAGIRANVMLSRPARDAAAAQAIRREADGYFALALRLISPPPPRLIAVGGLSGTGKSVLARALAGLVEPAPGAVLLRSDVARKQHFGVNETDRLPEHAYRPDVTATVYRTLAERAQLVLAQGHSAIVDAVFARPDERKAIAAVATKMKVPFDGVFLATDLATRIERVSRRTADASDATPEIVKRQQDYDPGSIDWTIVDASGSPQQTLQRATAALALDAGQACRT
ncbi:MAG: AAA family ATPase [Rhodopseudomonas sp.]|uniref:bifunctional aminoglycoside phosphotransferase/ATP-binding protein n=1 Tax=Rhodopseudomonas sp. TaxID=1078 RepID=UPI00179C442C|nr:bifunctional aminoglycoside phosphotransferase/ATP-binding protein [Rhodopseudomonas sp.]NVN87999.1 AAA family ATPase [Rhodopseudomonas sp.]